MILVKSRVIYRVGQDIFYVANSGNSWALGSSMPVFKGFLNGSLAAHNRLSNGSKMDFGMLELLDPFDPIQIFNVTFYA